MTTSDDSIEDLRTRLDTVLANGLAVDPIEHAQQVAEVTSIIRLACVRTGLDCVLVGGSAIEIHAPGIYRSGDIDLVIEGSHRVQHQVDNVFVGLGFEKEARHWRHREDLFIEIVSGPVAGPTQIARVGAAEFRIVTKEVVLRDRVVGFKQWKYTAYGQQAIAMISAFGDDVDMSWLKAELEREDSMDALQALGALAASPEPVTESVLRDLIDQLHSRSSS